MDFTDVFTVLKQGTPAGPYGTLAAAQEAGAVVIAWGVFLNAVISFFIVAFAVFLLVKALNRAKRGLEREVTMEPASPELTADQKLLTEIRDLLRGRPAA